MLTVEKMSVNLLSALTLTGNLIERQPGLNTLTSVKRMLQEPFHAALSSCNVHCDKKATSCVKKKIHYSAFNRSAEAALSCQQDPHTHTQTCADVTHARTHTHTHTHTHRHTHTHTLITGIDKCGELISKKDIGVILSRGGRAFMNSGLRDLAEEVKHQQPCPSLNSLRHYYLSNRFLLFRSMSISLYNCLSVYL